MSIANVFVVILIYALILSTLTIDKDVLYHVYILSVLYENNYKIICHTKTTIVLWKKNFIFIFIWKRKLIDNKLSNLWI